MKAAGKHQTPESILPKVPPEDNHLRTGPGLRMKQLKESFRTRRVSDKPAPVLSEKDIALFKYSTKRFVCVELLLRGHHKAFSELFSLLHLDQVWRAEAEPESALLKAPPLEEQRDKLEVIGLHLGRAEQFERTGFWTAVCEEHLFLGQYFSAQGDFLLSLYFYLSCAERERGGRSRPATEARGYLSELYLQQGDLKQARQQAELFLQQAEEGGWMDSNGQPLRIRACRRLGKIYILLGDALLADEDHAAASTLLHQGYGLAKQCEDKSMEGEAAFRLGLISQSSGDHRAARQFFNVCIQIFSSLQVAGKLEKTYRALAKSSESEGNIEETLQYLKKSADVCRSGELKDKLAEICLHLGSIYYNMNQTLEASEYFLQGYKNACEAGDVDLLQKAQVMVGRTCTPSLIRKDEPDVESVSSTSTRKSRGHQDSCTDPAD